MPKIFISYSHDSREHAERVLALADRLVRDGVDCVLDQYEESPAEGWTRWMDRQIRGAEFVLMIFTETYGKRVNGEEEAGKGLGVKWEGKLIYQHLYQADANTRFIPVVFAPEHVQFISTPLQDATYYLASSDEGYEKLYRRLTHQPKTQKPELGKLRELPPRERKQDFFITPQTFTLKLPTTTSELFGREDDLKRLDAAWADPHTHVLTLVAWGGVGKSALVNEWLARIAKENYRGAERVYAWSFYSQGTHEDRQVSGDEFIAHALKWFGDPDPNAGASWDKGARLAALLRSHKTLLVLDGLEPLQYPPGPLHGRLKDQGVQALLKQLAGDNNGLCIVTTRVHVADVAHKTKSSVQAVDLENLSAEAGAQLLKSLGVFGSEAELRAASNEYDGHALALNLLGSYLATVHEGEVRKRDLIPHLIEQEAQPGYHAYRVMASYEHWLAATPELEILFLMGLFDRPAVKGAIDALLAPPAIVGLTSNLQNLSFDKWQFTLKRLRELRLLAGKDSTRPDTLDCHPLVREYFGEKLRSQNLSAWKEAHSRLYEYYKNLPAQELPDTLEEMEPLFAAVWHGCKAGRYQESFSDICWKRILRSKELYVLKQIGAFGTILSTLSSFFVVQWSQPVSSLRGKDQSALLSWSGFSLRALGRLREAIQPMQAGLELRIKQKNWENAARDANNLSELFLFLGEVDRAIAFARQSVDFAGQGSDATLKPWMRTTLAEALYQSGELIEAQLLWGQAEAQLQQIIPKVSYLFSLGSFQFCDLLLYQRQYQEVEKRATIDIKIATTNKLPLQIGWGKLSLGKTLLCQAQVQTTDSSHSASLLNQTQKLFEQAVVLMRESAEQIWLCRALLERAALFRAQNEFALASADLDEAREIAERGEMKLFLADYHLEASKLQMAMGKKEKAKEHLAIAKEMIAQMGYGRRKPEAEELEKEIAHTDP